ncbi:MAG: response regulator [Alphaproteobacteria bacterium]
MPITLVIADDHPLILDALENLFRLEKDLQVVARCLDGDEALKAVRRHKPDILVLDIQMPAKDGLVVLREMRKQKLTTRVVVLTATIGDEGLAEALRLGVRGLVLKELAPMLLVQCIRKVHAGELWLEKHTVSSALERLLQREAGKQEAVQALTSREIEIIKQLATGLRNSEIAKRLFISEGTVKMHLHNIYQKLGVDTRLKLSRYAQEKGLL